MDLVLLQSKEHSGEELRRLLKLQPGIIAAVGGGGKTTVLQALCAALRVHSRVIFCTTTHIRQPQDLITLSGNDREQIAKVLCTENAACVGLPAEDGKLQAPACSISVLAEMADYVLVESDGSRGLPAKAPAAHEPVLPQGCTHVLAIFGLDAIGRPLCEIAHRPQLVADLLDCATLSHRLTPEDAACLLSSPRGQKKGVCDKMQYSIILNKADTPERCACALEIAQALPQDAAQACIITAFRQEG